MTNLHMSQLAINILADMEKCRLIPYDDGAGVWTVGVGHAIKPGEKIAGIFRTAEGKYVGKIDNSVAMSLFANDLQEFEHAVNALVTVVLKQYQFEALVMFSYNVGKNNFKTSTLLKEINDSNGIHESLRECVVEFERWNKANHHVMVGLQIRRIIEAAHYLNYTFSG